MSRRSRAGTAEKPPSVEETLGRLEVKLKELELKYELREKEESNYRSSISDTMETLRYIYINLNTVSQQISSDLAWKEFMDGEATLINSSPAQSPSQSGRAEPTRSSTSR